MSRDQLIESIRSATLAIKAASIAIRFELAMNRLQEAIEATRIERRYNPNWAAQSRVPRGNPDGGRWTTGGGGADVALNDWGRLVAEIPVRGGRKCVYRFETFSIVVDGPVNFPCQDRVPWSAVTHGQMLNDN